MIREWFFGSILWAVILLRLSIYILLPLAVLKFLFF